MNDDTELFPTPETNLSSLEVVGLVKPYHCTVTEQRPTLYISYLKQRNEEERKGNEDRSEGGGGVGENERWENERETKKEREGAQRMTENGEEAMLRYERFTPEHSQSDRGRHAAGGQTKPFLGWLGRSHNVCVSAYVCVPSTTGCYCRARDFRSRRTFWNDIFLVLSAAKGRTQLLNGIYFIIDFIRAGIILLKCPLDHTIKHPLTTGLVKNLTASHIGFISHIVHILS